jgi:hypothetical protein
MIGGPITIALRAQPVKARIATMSHCDVMRARRDEKRLSEGRAIENRTISFAPCGSRLMAAFDTANFRRAFRPR